MKFVFLIKVNNKKIFINYEHVHFNFCIYIWKNLCDLLRYFLNILKMLVINTVTNKILGSFILGVLYNWTKPDYYFIFILLVVRFVSGDHPVANHWYRSQADHLSLEFCLVYVVYYHNVWIHLISFYTRCDIYLKNFIFFY